MPIPEDDVLDKEQNQKHDKGYKDILSNKDAFLHFLKKYIAVSKIGKVLQTIKKEEVNVMTHALEVLFDELREDAAKNHAIEMAKRMIAKEKSTEEIMEFTGLDLNDVLKLKGLIQ